MTPDIKTRLAEIKEWQPKSIYDPDKNWLIDQLEQALAREEKLKEACTFIDKYSFEIYHGLQRLLRDAAYRDLILLISNKAGEALQSSQGPSNEERK